MKGRQRDFRRGPFRRVPKERRIDVTQPVSGRAHSNGFGGFSQFKRTALTCGGSPAVPPENRSGDR